MTGRLLYIGVDPKYRSLMPTEIRRIIRRVGRGWANRGRTPDPKAFDISETI
jgi:hypothetical protein